MTLIAKILIVASTVGADGKTVRKEFKPGAEVTGLSDHDEREFFLTIDEETDRLNRLVGNLLDMSRLETGVLQMAMRPDEAARGRSAASARAARGEWSMTASNSSGAGAWVSKAA